MRLAPLAGDEGVPSIAPQLQQFSNRRFERGRSAWVEALWLTCRFFLLSSWIPGALHRRVLLRAFGAKIGHSVNIKPRVRVTFPWKLAVGDHSWIGEGVWIDNLECVSVGKNCCL